MKESAKAAARFRVGIVGLLQESNTFIEDRTTLQHFHQDLLLRGEEIRKTMADAPHEVGGFLEELNDAQVEAVPIFFARAVPYGVIRAEAFDELVNEMLERLGKINTPDLRDGAGKAGRLDGLLAAAHGATVAENHEDADGHWLAAVRDVVGPDIPIIATIDPHANLSQRMVDATDALIAYATNPHVDQRNTGRKAASIMVRTLRREIYPTQAAAFPAMAINIQSQQTSVPPLADLYARASDMARGALCHSIVLGFPYADVSEMGSSVVVVTDGDPDVATATASAISEEMFSRRRQFEPAFVSASEAVRRAATLDKKPIVLLDMGDNVGGGSPADGTEILHAIQSTHALSAFACIYDPDAVQDAHSAGVGGRLPALAVGDRENPLVADFVVKSLHDGRFSEDDARHGGFTHFDQGPTAVLETEGTLIDNNHITVMVTSRRTPPYSLRQMTAFGLDPTDFQIIVAKGVIAPIAAYESVADGFVHVNTLGVTCADMTSLTYKNRRRPMYPFEDEREKADGDS